MAPKERVMKTLLVLGSLAALGLVWTQSASACGNQVTVKKVTLNEVAAWLKSDSAFVFDANNKATREKYGAVPGAVLLTSHREYDARELPPTAMPSSSSIAPAPNAARRTKRRNAPSITVTPMSASCLTASKAGSMPAGPPPNQPARNISSILALSSA